VKLIIVWIQHRLFQVEKKLMEKEYASYREIFNSTILSTGMSNNKISSLTVKTAFRKATKRTCCMDKLAF
jgi:hypothetical protein